MIDSALSNLVSIVSPPFSLSGCAAVLAAPGGGATDLVTLTLAPAVGETTTEAGIWYGSTGWPAYAEGLSFTWPIGKDLPLTSDREPGQSNTARTKTRPFFPRQLTLRARARAIGSHDHPPASRIPGAAVPPPVRNSATATGFRARQFGRCRQSFSNCNESRPCRQPIRITTYRPTEPHLGGTMSRWVSWLAEIQPEGFVEVSPELAAEKEIRNGDRVTLWTARGEVESRALVTSRTRR